jgi:hypothetical protein
MYEVPMAVSEGETATVQAEICRKTLTADITDSYLLSYVNITSIEPVCDWPITLSARLKFLTTMNVKTAVFLGMTSKRLVGGYRSFGEKYCLSPQVETGGNKIHRII